MFYIGNSIYVTASGIQSAEGNEVGANMQALLMSNASVLASDTLTYLGAGRYAGAVRYDGLQQDSTYTLVVSGTGSYGTRTYTWRWEKVDTAGKRELS